MEENETIELTRMPATNFMYKDSGSVLNQDSVVLIKVRTKLKVKCFLFSYFLYTQNITVKCKIT